MDNLFNEFAKMTTTELNMVTNAGRERASVVQVGTIAIANEVVRDFWVSNGYGYNIGTNFDSTFVYDYYNDCYIDKYGETNQHPIDDKTLLYLFPIRQTRNLLINQMFQDNHQNLTLSHKYT